MHIQNILSSPLFAMVLLCFGSSMANWSPYSSYSYSPKFHRPCPFFVYDAFYDLISATVTPSPFVTVEEGLFGRGCSTRGVLKLALASATTDPSRRRVLVDMFFRNPTDWVFNLGDSSTNNGFGGDAGTQCYDAEFHGNGRHMTGYFNQPAGTDQAISLQNLYTERLTLVAGDGQIVWLSDDPNVDNFNYMHNEGLFGLNGQPDTEGPVNYDLYLGINKVIDAFSPRTGSGLCKVGIKFLPEY